MSTDVGSAGSAETAELSTIDMNLEVVTLPVSDVDRAKSFYQSLGWRFDIDLVVSDDVRTVQFTPPHSECSIQFGKGGTTAEPGSAQAMFLVVEDIDAARDELDQPRRRRQRGAGGAAPGLRRAGGGALVLRAGVVQRPRRQPLGAAGDHDPAPRPGMGGLTWTSPRSRSCCTRPPMRHGSFEAVAPPHDWWDWYAAYMDARQSGSTPDEASAAAGRYMAEVKDVVVSA